MLALGVQMRISIFILFLCMISSFAKSENLCTFEKSREVNFVSTTSKDTFKITIKGKSCPESLLELTIISEDGILVHSHREGFSRWAWPEEQLQEKILAHANNLFLNAISDTSQLVTVFSCEIEEPNCEPYERNTIPMEKYLDLKKAAIPMIEHSTYYEGWAAWVYDTKSSKVIMVYEGGL